MLTVKFSSTAPKSRLNQIAGSITSTLPAMLDDCGKRLMGLAKMYFDTMASGGTGISGSRWPSPSAATRKRREALAKRGQLAGPVAWQGIITGQMRDSLRYDVGGNRVKVSYDAPQARWFNVHRRLIPSVLPISWRNALNGDVQGRLDAMSEGPVDRGPRRRSGKNRQYGDHR